MARCSIISLVRRAFCQVTHDGLGVLLRRLDGATFYPFGPQAGSPTLRDANLDHEEPLKQNLGDFCWEAMLCDLRLELIYDK